MSSASLRKCMRTYFYVILFSTISVSAACNNSSNKNALTPSSNQTSVTTPSDEGEGVNTTSGYPSGLDTNQGYPDAVPEGTTDSGYPAPNIYEDLLSTPPDPEVELPAAEQTTGVIGGVLIREVVDYGFEPLTPVSLSLADVLLTTDGQPAFIRAGDDSAKAQLFPTGIFIFQNVSPGEYGFMVDVGYTQFPITGDDGIPLLVQVEAGDVIDMGQVITQLPAE